MLIEKTKEELIEIILEKDRQVDELAARVRALEEKVKAEQKRRTEKFTKANTKKRKWNNNLAERMIRPNVICRSRSFGNRSDRGAEAHGTIMPLMQTLRLQGKNVTENLRIAFLKHRQGHAAPCRSPGTC